MHKCIYAHLMMGLHLFTVVCFISFSYHSDVFSHNSTKFHGSKVVVLAPSDPGPVVVACCVAVLQLKGMSLKQRKITDRKIYE